MERCEHGKDGRQEDFGGHGRSSSRNFGPWKSVPQK